MCESFCQAAIPWFCWANYARWYCIPLRTEGSTMQAQAATLLTQAQCVNVLYIGPCTPWKASCVLAWTKHSPTYTTCDCYRLFHLKIITFWRPNSKFEQIWFFSCWSIPSMQRQTDKMSFPYMNSWLLSVTITAGNAFQFVKMPGTHLLQGLLVNMQELQVLYSFLSMNLFNVVEV